MKNRLNEAFDDIDEKYADKTAEPPKRNRTLRLALIAAVIAVLMILPTVTGAVLLMKGQNGIADDPDSVTTGSVGKPDDDTTKEPEATNETDPAAVTKRPTDDLISNPFNGEAGNYSGAKYSSVADM